MAESFTSDMGQAAPQPFADVLPETPPIKSKVPVGIGIPTLVTILMVLFLALFSVFTLVSAKDNLSLSQQAAGSVSDYYGASNDAVQWYAGLDSFVKAGNTTAAALTQGGYTVAPQSAAGTVVVSKDFPYGSGNTLTVSVNIGANGQLTTTQWSTQPAAQTDDADAANTLSGTGSDSQ